MRRCIVADRIIAGLQRRRFLVLVNPFGGAGQGKKVYENKCRPIFEASECSVDVACECQRWGRNLQLLKPTDTQYRGHAFDMAKEAAQSMGNSYNAIVCVSGDGLIHEVINGISANDAGDLTKAAEQLRSLPVAVIPAGSGNAMSCCLLGPKRGADPYWATLQAIKGKAMATDLISITDLDKKIDSHPPGTSRYLSFLSQAYGLTADCDLGTEHLRWMGDSRFVLGMMTGILGRRVYGGTLDIFVVDQGDDVQVMRKKVRAQRNGEIEQSPNLVNDLICRADGLGDSEQHSVMKKVGKWVSFEGPFSMFYAGLGPCEFDAPSERDILLIFY